MSFIGGFVLLLEGYTQVVKVRHGIFICHNWISSPNILKCGNSIHVIVGSVRVMFVSFSLLN